MRNSVRRTAAFTLIELRVVIALVAILTGFLPPSLAGNNTQTSVSSFTGGDPGEGLDLQGNFVFALDVVADGFPVGAAGDANFTEDTVEGVTIQASFSFGQGTWGLSEFGSSQADNVLEFVMQSVRYDTSPGVKVTLDGLSPGSAYKLQLLFYENCCVRAFDVKVNGAVIVDEFAPFVIQGGIGNSARGVVVTHNFITTSDSIEIHLDGTGITTPAYSDHNPILNGLTLEFVAANEDSDSDGLSDPWEIGHFGNLAQTAAGDPDGDGLNNAGEFDFGSDPQQADVDGDTLNDLAEKAAGTNPNAADTDGDGLNDAAELNTHDTDPSLADSDGDTLPDGAEVITYSTNPKSLDSDNDTFADNIEIFSGANPNDAGSKPGNTLVQPVTGGDPGEGLDLQGTFLYAVDVVLPTGTTPGQAGDANFTESNVGGVLVTAMNNINVGGWGASSYGDSPADDVIETVMQSIQSSGSSSPLEVNLANLVPGRAYKLQLLFYEHCCARAFDVVVEGEVILHEFAPFMVQGGIGTTGKGAVVAHEFVAADDSLNILLDGSPVTNPAYQEHSPILAGFTLEDFADAAVGPRINTIALEAAGISINFQSVPGTTYNLEYKEKLSDPLWSATASITATGTTSTITDNSAGHRTPATGFWRLRVQ